MNDLQNSVFSQLLSAWRRRDDARHSGNLRQLADARFELDRARSRMQSTLQGVR